LIENSFKYIIIWVMVMVRWVFISTVLIFVDMISHNFGIAFDHDIIIININLLNCRF